MLIYTKILDNFRSEGTLPLKSKSRQLFLRQSLEAHSELSYSLLQYFKLCSFHKSNWSLLQLVTIYETVLPIAMIETYGFVEINIKKTHQHDKHYRIQNSILLNFLPYVVLWVTMSHCLSKNKLGTAWARCTCNDWLMFQKTN